MQPNTNSTQKGRQFNTNNPSDRVVLFIKVSLLALALFLMVGVGYGVECDSSLSAGTNCSISTNGTLTLDGQIHFINATTDSTAAIRFLNETTTLDCAGGGISGNGTGFGFNLNSHTGITIKNCKIYNYYTGINAPSWSNRSVFNNNTIINVSLRGIAIVDDAPSKTYATISNNYIECNHNRTGIFIQRGNFYTVVNNTIKNCYAAGVLTTTNTGAYFGNVNISNNNFYNSDQHIAIFKGNNYTIAYNNFYNSTNNYDDYDSAVTVTNASQVYFGYNNIYESATNGIRLTKVNNFTIEYNSINAIDINERYKYKAQDYNEPITGIQISQLYKTWIGNSLETGNAKDISYIGQFNSSNGLIRGNTFNVNVQVPLKLQGVVNLTQDISDVWVFKYWMPMYLQNGIELYISNNFNQLSNYAVNEISTTFFEAYSDPILYTSTDNRMINWTLERGKFYLKNVNDTQSYNVTVSNFTNSNFSIYNITGSKVVSNNVANTTFTVNSNEEFKVETGCVYAEDNFTITSGMNVTLCPMDYIGSDVNNDGFIRIGKSGGINSIGTILDCNGVNIIGAGIGRAIRGINYQDIQIKNCNIKNFNEGISFVSNSGFEKNLNITNSLIYNCTSSNIIILNTNNTIIDNVTSYGSKTSHGLYFSNDKSAPQTGFYNSIIRNSKFYNNSKNGIQFNGGNQQDGLIKNAIVSNNLIYENDQNGINDLACFNCSIYNNQIYNNNWQAYAFYYDVSNTQPINSSSRNNVIFNNNFYSNPFSFYVGNYSLSNVIIGNTYDELKIYLVNNFNITISETVDNILLNFTNNGYFIWHGNSLKNINVTNNTLKWSGLGSYADCFNSSQTTSFCSDKNTCNSTIGSGERVVCLQYADSKKWIKEVPTTTSDISYSVGSDGLTITCTGAGFTAQYLTDFMGENGVYTVLHNGEFYGYGVTDEYTVTDCSTWTFTPNELTIEANSSVDTTSQSLGKLMRVFGLLAGILVIIFAIGGLYKGVIDEQQFMYIIFTVVVTAVAFAIMLAVLEFI